MSGLAFFDLPEEQNRGIALFAEPLQVLEEYFAAEAHCRVVRFGGKDVIAAIEFHRLTRPAGAETLYSEDLQLGAVLGGVRVVNPFIV
jgi:hypothetical protein